MAATNTIEYCTDRDLLDVYPSISTSDSKFRIYNWSVDSGSRYKAPSSGYVSQLFADGTDLGAAQANSGAVNVNAEWYFNDSDNILYYYNDATSPADMVMEAGEDATTFRQRMRRNASRLVEAKTDSRLSREIWRDREGEYPYIIKRTASLMAVAMMLKADDPMSEVAAAFNAEAVENIDALNNGVIQLPQNITMDSAKGVIRDVTYTAGSVRPVQTRGLYNGTFDLLKITIGTGGAIGTCTYSVYEKSSSTLKANQVISAQTINGDFQELAGGLQVRFSGLADATVATANDEWEIEVYGAAEQVSVNAINTIQLTRGSGGYAGNVKGGYRAAGNRRFKL